MKRTRKILSFVLSVLVAFASMPTVYVSTAAEYAASYKATQTSTLDNPTEPVEASGTFSYDDLYKLNIDIENTNYTFYQTQDDEYFTFTQYIGLQKKYETDASDKTLTFEGVSHYTGSTDSTTVNESGVGQGTDLMEVPAITTNNTEDFLNKYYFPDNTWTAVNNNATAVGNVPENVILEGKTVDIAGCKKYNWSDKFIIKGLSASEGGEINTSFYDSYKWNWKMNDDSASAKYELRIETKIRILDAREFVKELKKAENILANSENYTEAYISSVEATLNSIPDSLKSLSEVYSQSEIDRYTEAIKTISLNSADYTEYNKVYKSLNSISNEMGAFTDASFEAFKTEINRINTNLPKNLDKTKQDIVDAATQALKDAYEILVATDISETEDSYYFQGTENSGYVDITVKNVNLKFMQTKDNQQFTFTQSWILNRTGGSNKRIIYRVTIDDTYPLYCGDTSCQSIPSITENKTSEFLARMNSGYTTLTANDANDKSFTAKEFTTWASDDGLVSNGMFIHEVGLEEKSYTATITPTFVGNSATESGEITSNFVQRIGYKYYTGFFQYKYRHFHVNSTVTVTDVRQLIGAVEDAKETLNNPGTHSEEYLVALKAAVDSVPDDLLNGTKYYTQEIVDKFLSDITTIPEQVADYSEFTEVFEKMTSLDKSNYTEESYSTFIDEIYEINRNLPKNLTAENQAIVNEAVDALYAAQDKLVSKHLNDDSVFTQDDIGEYLGNSPFEFSLSSTQYNFMQIADGQKFALRTDFTGRNTKSNYNLYLRSLGFSVSTPDNRAGTCTSDNHCHKLDTVTNNQTELFVSNVSGVKELTYTDGVVTVDNEGNITEHNTWVNTQGTALSSNGILIDNAKFSRSNSSACAEIYYTGASGENSATTDLTYVLWLGWSYAETFIGIEASDKTYRHVHIPINVKITDARALNALYGEVEDIVNGRLETDYTLESLLNLYNAFQAVPSDMANGEEFYSQEAVDAQYTSLKAAYDGLVEGADYNEYFDAYLEAQKIIETGNDDGYGNKLYDDEAFNELVNTVTAIHNGLDKDLSATEENQQTIDSATSQIKEAVAKAELSKRADYTDLEKAMDEAEKILNAPEGTYTDKTISNIQEIYDNAAALDKNLPASEQSTVDTITEQLENAVANADFKADYSEYYEAYNKVQEIINNPDKYTEETVEAAQNAMNTAGSIDKDLADTAENREIIANATEALNVVLNNAEEKADYSELEEAVKKLDDILNAPEGTYTDETISNAQEAKNAYDNLDKDLSKNEQSTVDSVTDAINNAVNGAEEKADYTDYNNAKAEADSLVNEDENGNPIYDEEAFNAYKEAVNGIDDGLSKDLAKDKQSVVDNATSGLRNLKTELESKRYYTVTFKDENGSVLSAERCLSGTVFNTITAPSIPENTDETAYFGWYYENGSAIDGSIAVTSDITAVIFAEAKQLIPTDSSNITIDSEKGLITGVDKNTSVDDILLQFENDETVVEIKSYTGAVLTREDLVGTGSTITLKSKFTGEIYESRTVIIYGDLDGDGDVDQNDCDKALNVCLGCEVHTEDNYYFFIANDIAEDGVIDVLDVFYIERIMNK